MEYFYVYCLFAVTTAFASIYELLLPVIMLESKDGRVEYQYIMYVTFFAFSLLIAPMVFLSCIVPSMGDRFREALSEGLFPKQ